MQRLASPQCLTGAVEARLDLVAVLQLGIYRIASGIPIGGFGGSPGVEPSDVLFRSGPSRLFHADSLSHHLVGRDRQAFRICCQHAAFAETAGTGPKISQPLTTRASAATPLASRLGNFVFEELRESGPVRSAARLCRSSQTGLQARPGLRRRRQGRLKYLYMRLEDRDDLLLQPAEFRPAGTAGPEVVPHPAPGPLRHLPVQVPKELCS